MGGSSKMLGRRSAQAWARPYARTAASNVRSVSGDEPKRSARAHDDGISKEVAGLAFGLGGYAVADYLDDWDR